MKIVQGDEIPVLEGASPVRGGTLNKRHILTGDEGTPGNFVFGLYYQTGDFVSPRHRHNFDQFRFQLEGECDFDRNGTMRAGTLGYFPEGAFYGPQSSTKPNVTALIQFGGPSGAGYVSQRQVYEAVEELKKFGVFEKGIYRRNQGVEGKKNMDAFQAAWEHVHQRPMVYPKPQYADPILIDTENYRWLPLEGAPGVTAKNFGIFTECGIRAVRYRLDKGATLPIKGRGIYLALSGRGTVGAEPLRALTTIYLEAGEHVTVAAEETTDVLLMGLPDPALMRHPSEAQSRAA
jgi:hypothetical protein